MKHSHNVVMKYFILMVYLSRFCQMVLKMLVPSSVLEFFVTSAFSCRKKMSQENFVGLMSQNCES